MSGTIRKRMNEIFTQAKMKTEKREKWNSQTAETEGQGEKRLQSIGSSEPNLYEQGKEFGRDLE